MDLQDCKNCPSLIDKNGIPYCEQLGQPITTIPVCPETNLEA